MSADTSITHRLTANGAEDRVFVAPGGSAAISAGERNGAAFDCVLAGVVTFVADRHITAKLFGWHEAGLYRTHPGRGSIVGQNFPALYRNRNSTPHCNQFGSHYPASAREAQTRGSRFFQNNNQAYVRSFGEWVFRDDQST